MRTYTPLLLCLLAAPATGQPAPMPNIVTPDTTAAPQTAEQLQHLVASIALYPDPILTDILAASTYPAQVVEAERFLADPANADLQGQALRDAALQHHWDASIIALLDFPQLLQKMDTNLEYTEHLGRAFLAQPADVLAAIQTLRQSAQTAGTLADGPDASVLDEGGVISIEPPSPGQVFLPSYNDACAFGPSADCSGTPDLVWGDPITLPFDGLFWGEVDWSHHAIRLGARSQWRGQHVPGFWRHPGGAFHGVIPASAPAPSDTQVYGRTTLYGHALPGIVQRSPVVSTSPHFVHSAVGGVRSATHMVAPAVSAPHITGSSFHH